jgi:hypothetical protein
MHVLLLVAVLGAQRAWTGDFRAVNDGVFCEFDDVGWRSLRELTECPDVLPKTVLTRADLKSELLHLDASRPTGVWYLPTGLSIALGAMVAFSALLAVAGWPNDPGVPAIFGISGLWMLISGIVTSAWLRQERAPFEERISEIEETLGISAR